MRGRRIGAAVVAALLATAASSASAASGGVSIDVLSNRADLISGGNALVAITVPAGVDPARLRVSFGKHNVSRAFALRRDGRYEGLVHGLANGRNVLKARLPSGRGAQIVIKNHPNGGPVFSGPQVQPWTCQKSAVDAECDQPPFYRYLYQSRNPTTGLKPYDPDHPAKDVATTTTDQGVTVPFIVRVETGFEDRDEYKILTLFQPGKAWEPWAPQPQFDHKLLITHGGGCNVAYTPGDAPLADFSGTIPPLPLLPQSYVVALGRGFAVMSTALDNDGHNCNIVTQAESLVMAKEHLIETYGTLRYAIGTGCSGGSLTQQQVANAYPGIYQGLLPTCSFPDAWTAASEVADYHLLRSYFEKLGPRLTELWTPLQWGAVEGNALPLNAIVSDLGYFSAFDPTHACAGISAQQRYDPQRNPAGVRCGVPDYMINVLGPRRPDVWGPQERALGHGFAGIAVDNVGAQYGLATLQQHLITPAQFVDLNAKIGGLSIDIKPTAQRTAADEPALANVYRSGAIDEANNLGQVAIIDGRGPDPGLAHDAFRAFAMRARLDRENGTHANQVIWEGPVPIFGDARYAVDGFMAMDRWLSAVEADHSSTPLAQKIIGDRPADIHDRCSDGAGLEISDQLCPNLVVPAYATPRIVAGDAITTTTNKCRLKPLARADYNVSFTAAEWSTLQSAFPSGVCDFSKPGVDERRTIAWQTYQDARGHVIYGGRPLGPPPHSVALRPKKR